MEDKEDILEQAARRRGRGEPFAMVTVVRCSSPTSAKPGAKALVDTEGRIHGWIGGGCAQPAVIKTARRAMQDGEPRFIRISPGQGDAEAGVEDFAMPCHSGGTLEIFVDPILPQQQLLILGASPVARSLAGLAGRVGFAVTVAFPGIEAEDFPEAERVIDGFDPGSPGASAAQQVVVASQGKRDERALETALETGAAHIAFVASGRKAAKLRDYLMGRGHDPERVAAIISPAGVEIGARTPEEIALSVLAGLVQARRLGELAAAPAEEVVHASEPGQCEAPSAEAVDPVCGMTVRVAEAEHRADHEGVTYYFCCGGCRQAFQESPEQYTQAVGAD